MMPDIVMRDEDIGHVATWLAKAALSGATETVLLDGVARPGWIWHGRLP